MSSRGYPEVVLTMCDWETPPALNPEARGDAIRSHRRGLSPTSLPPSQTPVTSPGRHLRFCLTGHRLELPHPSREAHRTETHSLLGHWFIVEGTARWKTCGGQMKGGGEGGICVLGKPPLSPCPHPMPRGSPTWKLSEPHPSGFLGGSMTQA